MERAGNQEVSGGRLGRGRPRRGEEAGSGSVRRILRSECHGLMNGQDQLPTDAVQRVQPSTVRATSSAEPSGTCLAQSLPNARSGFRLNLSSSILDCSQRVSAMLCYKKWRSCGPVAKI